MSERSISSILDRFRKKKGDKAEASETTTEPKKPESVLTEQENTRLKGYLVQAKEQEKAGNQAEALKLYSEYKQEFLAIKNKSKETVEGISPEVQEALSEIFAGEVLIKLVCQNRKNSLMNILIKCIQKLKEKKIKPAAWFRTGPVGGKIKPILT
jgi:hypothetical protein